MYDGYSVHKRGHLIVLWSIEIRWGFYRDENEINTVMGLWVTER